MVAKSGYGIISGYSDGETKQESQQMPKYYDRIGYCYGNSDIGYMRWDFEANPQPDVVVINLGTNDDSYYKSFEDRQAEYTAAYVEFLKTVREKNPNATIFCTLGIMGDNLFKCVEEAAATYSAETGDTNIHTMAFDVQSARDGYAADWHPTEATHEKAAAKLVEEITTVMGW